MRTLAERLIWAREAAGLKQRELARAAKLKSERHVGLIESGERTNFELRIIATLAETLGLTLGWLANGEGEAPTAAHVAAHTAHLRTEEVDSEPTNPEVPIAKHAPEPPRAPDTTVYPDPEFQAKSRAQFNRIQLSDVADDETTVRDAAVAGVKVSERERVATDKDPRAGEELQPTPKPLTVLDIPENKARRGRVTTPEQG